LKHALFYIVCFVLVFAGFYLVWPSMNEFLAIDSCLDRGGSYDYAHGLCDLEGSRSFGLNEQRNSKTGLLLLIAGMIIGLLTLYHHKRSVSDIRFD